MQPTTNTDPYKLIVIASCSKGAFWRDAYLLVGHVRHKSGTGDVFGEAKPDVERMWI